jgi:hypothetical protein
MKINFKTLDGTVIVNERISQDTNIVKRFFEGSRIVVNKGDEPIIEYLYDVLRTVKTTCFLRRDNKVRHLHSYKLIKEEISSHYLVYIGFIPEQEVKVMGLDGIEKMILVSEISSF